MHLFVKPLRGINYTGVTFRNNTFIAYGEFPVADKVLSQPGANVLRHFVTDC
jgi:hypothetical protein